MSSPGRTIMRWRLPSALQVSQPTGSIQHSERPAVLAAASRRRQAACHVGINRPSAAIAASASAIVGTTSRLFNCSQPPAFSTREALPPPQTPPQSMDAQQPVDRP